MTFTNEQAPINNSENNLDKIKILSHNFLDNIPESVKEGTKAKIIALVPKHQTKLEALNNYQEKYSKAYEFVSKAAIYFNDYGPYRA